MPNKIKLTENELKDLMFRYYAGEKNSMLIKEFELTVKTNQIHTLFPLIERDDLVCPYCDMQLVQKPLSKSSAHNQRIDDSAYCKKCGHRNYEYCRCDNCEKKRINKAEKLTRKKRDIIYSTHRPARSKPIDISNLPLIDALSLVSLARAALNEKSNKIIPLKFHSLSFCVRDSTTLSVLEKLYEAGLIEISLESDLRSVSLDKEGNTEIEFELACWVFKLGKNSNESLMVIESLEEIFRTEDKWPIHWTSEIASVWQELALEEVLSYLSRS